MLSLRPVDCASTMRQQAQVHFQIETAIGRIGNSTRTENSENWKRNHTMKLFITLIAAAVAATAATALEKEVAQIDSRVAELCGTGHVNEIAGPDDIRSNPDGYFVTSLNEQISLEDGRIVFTNAQAPYLCTRSAATPDMDMANVSKNADRRTTSWLFVPFQPMDQ
jgi:hypothetical protein